MHALQANDEEGNPKLAVAMNSDFSGDMYLFVYGTGPTGKATRFEYEMPAQCFKELVAQGFSYFTAEEKLEVFKELLA